MITPEFPPQTIGGGGVVFENLANQYKNSGYTVKVITGNFNNKKIIGKIISANLNPQVVYLPLLPFPKSSKYQFSSYNIPSVKAVIYVTNEVFKTKDTIIHLHGFCHPLIDFTAFLCILLRKKYIITCHGVPKRPEKFQFPVKNLFQLYLTAIEGTVVRKAFALTSISKTLTQELITKGLVNKNTFIIQNGPNTALIKTKPSSREEIEQKFNLKNKKVVFAIGRLSPEKGFQFLIEAMADVTKNIAEVSAVIAGVGPYQKTLTNLIKQAKLEENVKLIGHISEEDKAALYERSDLVVFPSIQEPFGIVALEALMMKKPLLVFDTPTSKEILNKNCCLMIPTGDSKQLSDAITKVLTDANMRTYLTKASNEGKFYSWQEIASQYVKVFDKNL